MNRRRSLWVVGVALMLAAAGLVAWPPRVAVFALAQGGFDLTIRSALGAERVAQTMHANYPGLAEIEVNVTGFVPPLDQPVTMRVRAAEDGALVREVTGAIGEFHNDWKLIFPFAPIDESAGQRYVVELETPGPAPLQLMTHSRDVYPAGALAQGGDLMFTARYRGYWAPTLAAFVGQLTAGKPGGLAQPWPYLAAAGAFLFLLAGALRRLAVAARAPLGDPS